MDARTRKTLDPMLSNFFVDVQFSESMVGALREDGFQVTHISQGAHRSWLLRAKPPQAVQEGFGLAPEILLVTVQGEVQARDLRRASDEVVRSELRLDSNLVIVTDDKNSPLQDRLDRLPGRDQRIAWVWDDEGHWPPLSEVLRRQLPTYDVFEERDPVRGSQLMGRTAEVAELRTRVLRGDAVGVFGLRKVGKTSLVRAVTDWLDPASGTQEPAEESTPAQAHVLWIDAQSLDEDASVDDVADELLAALRRRMRAARAPYKLPTKAGIAGLKHAIEGLLDQGERICFVIDEYDLLFEREGSRGPIDRLSKLFRRLRAWAQQCQGKVSLVLIGRDPEHLATPLLDGITNPLLAWFTPMWLGPLGKERATDMLRRLGRRVGLDIGHQTAALAHAWTFGHPLLHRQFGSALREEIERRSPPTLRKIETDPYCDAAVSRFCNRDAVLTVNREIVALLSKRYPPAYTLMRVLAEEHDAAAVLERAGGPAGEPARVLHNFGLLDEGTLTLPKYLSWYVESLLPRSMPVAV